MLKLRQINKMEVSDMDNLTAIVVVLPSILSTLTTCVYAYIAWKKSKEPPKDEIWETAVKLMCSKDDCYSTADDFAKLYRELKFFKEHPEKIENFTMIEQAMESYTRERAEGLDASSTPIQQEPC